MAGRLLKGDRAARSVTPTELVHGAAVKVLRQRRIATRDRGHFLAYCARLMRQVLLDQIRAERALKRTGIHITLVSDIADAGHSSQHEFDLEALDRALVQLERISPELARLIELRFFSGMTMVQIAELDELSLSTIKRQWRAARAWLLDEIKTGGSPANGNVHQVCSS